MRRRIATLAVGAILLAAWPCAAGAQQAPDASQLRPSAPGMLTTRSFTESPAGATVFVAPYDDSDLNLQLKADFAEALRDTGHAQIAVEKSADLLLLFESEVLPADLAPRPPSLGSAQASEQGAEVNVNVWSSTQDSVLGGRQEGAKAGSNVFHLNAVLRNQKTGEVVWQGDAYYVLSEPAPERVARALVRPLVAKIGQSVAREPLQIE